MKMDKGYCFIRRFASKAMLFSAALLILTCLPAKPAYTQGAEVVIRDLCSDFSKVLEATSNIAVSKTNPIRYDGDNGRFYKQNDNEAFLLYKVPSQGDRRFTDFQVITWYEMKEPTLVPGDMIFETSASGEANSFSPVAGVVKVVREEPVVQHWRKVTWTAASLPADARYVKVRFGATSSPDIMHFNLQIGEVTLTVADQTRPSLGAALTEARTQLEQAVVGSDEGQYPQWAVDDFAAAIAAGDAVFQNPSATEPQLWAAYADFLQARENFALAQIKGPLNWPRQAAITVSSAEWESLTVEWPHIAEIASYPDMVYEIRRNQVLLDTVTASTYNTPNTYTMTGLRPQVAYEFTVTARAGGHTSPVLGPTMLSTRALAPVPAPNFSLINPNDFTDDNYLPSQVWSNDSRGIPFYFKHFHTLANAVKLDQPNRGFINLVVHRNPAHNFPFNARIQENHLWFTYFYTNPASWNIYYGMPEVKYRLEEVLEHLLTLQGPDGAFSEYGWENYNLPATTFGLQFLGQTIRLLEEARIADPGFPLINEDLYNRLIAASKKAIIHVLNDPARWEHGTAYTNQYTLVWSGVSAYLAYHPDADIEAKMKQRLAESATSFISPAGFYYENNSFDMGYNMGVHLQNLLADYYYFKDTDIEAQWLAKEARFFDWLSYNLVLEPDGSHFTSNAAASSRTGSSHIERKDIPLAEKLPLARAFVKTQEEAAAEIAQAKLDVVKDNIWPNVPNLALKGESSYNPSGLFNHIFYRYYPTKTEHDAAVGTLPYLANDSFNHQRNDDRSGLQFTYVRKPEYYAAFNAGPNAAAQQSFGLGLLWHPEGGILLNGQTESDSLIETRGMSWGTLKAGNLRVYEASSSVLPVYKLNGQVFQPATGYGDLPEGQLQVEYALGSAGTKSLVFGEKEITVTVGHTGAFTEYVPLMIEPNDQIDLQQGLLTLTRDKMVLKISFAGNVTAALTPTTYKMYKYGLQQLTLKANGALTYKLQLETLEDENSGNGNGNGNGTEGNGNEGNGNGNSNNNGNGNGNGSGNVGGGDIPPAKPQQGAAPEWVKAEFPPSGGPALIQSSLAAIEAPSNMFAGQNLAQAAEIGFAFTAADGQQTDSLNSRVKQAIGGRPVVSIAVAVNGEPVDWSNPDAPVTVRIPYAPSQAELANPELLEKITVWRIDANGVATAIPNARYDAQAAGVTFTATELTRFAVVLEERTFDDLGAVPWARREIDILASRGVINGMTATNFAPLEQIRRADFTKLFVQALGLSAKESGEFTDVGEADYYKAEVAIAAQRGIVNGYSDGSFKPIAPISRQEMMVIAARQLRAAGKLPEGAAEGLAEQFADADNIAPYAKEDIAALVQAEIIQGSGGLLNPQGTATRAEAAVLLYRLVKLQ